MMFHPLMNHIFTDYIWVSMDVYMDDIVIYSDIAEHHIIYMKVINCLCENKFFLSAHKIQSFKELKILRHIIDSIGIWMHSEKVHSIVKWKTPTNKSLCL